MLGAGRIDRFGRGQTLALVGDITSASKAEPVRVRRDMTVRQGFETIVCSCLRHYRLNEPIVMETRDKEALHQVRVAIRRLRSALALFRPAVADEKSQRIEAELRWLIAEFGDARNLDVFLERNLPADQRSFLSQRRTDAYDRAIAAMDSDRAQRLMVDLLAWTTTGQWQTKVRARMPFERFVNRRIDRIWSKVARSRRVARLNDKRRHKLRIRVKKLRYGLEFADALHGNSRHKKRFTKTLKRAQEALGGLHDIVTARSLVSLNSWLMTEEVSAGQERHLVRAADGAFTKLKKTGPYWPDSLLSKAPSWLT
jgi:triphosphatase